MRRGLLVCSTAVAAVVAGGAPEVASAKALGGVTRQSWPVLVELNKKGTKVVRATAGVTLECTPSMGIISLPDVYSNMKVSKKGKFGSSFGPDTMRNDDGTTTDFEGSMSGKLNAARTKASGKWQLKVTDHAATGAVTDTCDSGTVRWKAKD